MRTYLLLLLALSSLFMAPAASAQSTCGLTGYTVAYANGMGRLYGIDGTFLDALDSLRELRKVGGDRHNSLPVHYDLLYNSPQGKAVDLLEVFRQKVGEINSAQTLSQRGDLFWEVLRGDYSSFDRAKAVADSATALAIDQLRDALTLAFGSATSGSPLYSVFFSSQTNRDYAQHESQLLYHIGKRRGLLLVGYSQGSFFVNAAYDRLQGRFGISGLQAIYIAPPSQTMRGSGSYVLSANDKVIKALSGVGVTLSPNISIPPQGNFDSGHGLVATYLRNNGLADDGTLAGGNGYLRVSKMLQSALSALRAAPCSRTFRLSNTFESFASSTPGFLGQSGSYTAEFTLAGIPSNFTGTADASDVVSFGIDFTSDQDFGDFYSSRGAVIYASSTRAPCSLCVSPSSAYYLVGQLIAPKFTFINGQMTTLTFGVSRTYTTSSSVVGTKLTDAGTDFFSGSGLRSPGPNASR